MTEQDSHSLHSHLSTEATLGIIFGILTIVATIASIRCKDSICSHIARFYCRSRRRRAGACDLENAATVTQRSECIVPCRDTLELRYWPSPYEASQMEMREWDRVRRSGSVEEERGLERG
ncbi:uncharacterized protein BDZ99DRAFT_521123 [Mytilinidion resinicola]|uniref:Uncharacterized protein n=1 Tax=Mytilinidion resinicola TaxID=574789 RepID=A0A6A6YLQ3_9PEZI|nr:uncharacterized protein BDZ99DRAFT_521123 [Mytilinidion resinicola]KAF2809806.1 hypothetical protein BDZ99DRAFT_521123 [Mytilinidion resinicola]